MFENMLTEDTIKYVGGIAGVVYNNQPVLGYRKGLQAEAGESSRKIAGSRMRANYNRN